MARFLKLTGIRSVFAFKQDERFSMTVEVLAEHCPFLTHTPVLIYIDDRTSSAKEKKIERKNQSYSFTKDDINLAFVAPSQTKSASSKENYHTYNSLGIKKEILLQKKATKVRDLK